MHFEAALKSLPEKNRHIIAQCEVGFSIRSRGFRFCSGRGADIVMQSSGYYGELVRFPDFTGINAQSFELSTM